MISTVLIDLTVGELLAGIPRDAGAIVAFLLMGLFVGLIWLGSRPKKGQATAGRSEAAERSALPTAPSSSAAVERARRQQSR